MTPYPVVRRQLAQHDIEEAAFWYATESNEATAQRFVAAVETAIVHIAAHPDTGSLRYAMFSPHNALRFWPLRKFPWLVFYRVMDDRIDVWRVLHAERDLPRWLIVED